MTSSLREVLGSRPFFRHTSLIRPGSKDQHAWQRKEMNGQKIFLSPFSRARWSRVWQGNQQEGLFPAPHHPASLVMFLPESQVWNAMDGLPDPVSPLLHRISKRPVIPLTLHSHPKKRRKEKSKTSLPLKQTPLQEFNFSIHFLELKLLLRGKEMGKPSLGVRQPCQENMKRKE